MAVSHLKELDERIRELEALREEFRRLFRRKRPDQEKMKYDRSLIVRDARTKKRRPFWQ